MYLVFLLDFFFFFFFLVRHSFSATASTNERNTGHDLVGLELGCADEAYALYDEDEDGRLW